MCWVEVYDGECKGSQVCSQGLGVVMALHLNMNQNTKTLYIFFLQWCIFERLHNFWGLFRTQLANLHERADKRSPQYATCNAAT